MSAPPFMPLYVGDFLADTVHLNGAETGAYLMILMCMWRSGGSLPNDPSKLARFAKVTPQAWARIEGSVMAFFTVEGGKISQARLSRELEKYEVSLMVRRERSSAGGKAKALKNNNPVVPQAPLKRANQNQNSEPEPEIDKSSVAKATSQRRKATCISPDWKPTPDDIQFAMHRGFLQSEIMEEADAFRDYWLSTGRNAAKTNWSLTFRNRIRDRQEHRQAVASRTRPGNGRSDVTDFASIIARRRNGTGHATSVSLDGGLLFGDDRNEPIGGRR